MITQTNSTVVHSSTDTPTDSSHNNPFEDPDGVTVRGTSVFQSEQVPPSSNVKFVANDDIGSSHSDRSKNPFRSNVRPSSLVRSDFEMSSLANPQTSVFSGLDRTDLETGRNQNRSRRDNSKWTECAYKLKTSGSLVAACLRNVAFPVLCGYIIYDSHRHGQQGQGDTAVATELFLSQRKVAAMSSMVTSTCATANSDSICLSLVQSVSLVHQVTQALLLSRTDVRMPGR
ncbi:hypothetical protein BCR39DRAFT_528481 [Naematelia encephala]|uniref:Uncharacterized protein n=1 Tax=Naematelia encephala TaxID=71784 RepID=A0A1Y2B7U5_9TREE|nr:hypothetical protein BCR39DRAFT_528481 [Naematelia encephala]